MSVHIFRAADQPAHRFVVHVGMKGERIWVRHPKRRLVHCIACSKKRWAHHCTVQVYYDSIRYFCRSGRGCKKAKP